MVNYCHWVGMQHATELDHSFILGKIPLFEPLHSGGYSPLVGATVFPVDKTGFPVKKLV